MEEALTREIPLGGVSLGLEIDVSGAAHRALGLRGRLEHSAEVHVVQGGLELPPHGIKVHAEPQGGLPSVEEGLDRGGRQNVFLHGKGCRQLRGPESQGPQLRRGQFPRTLQRSRSALQGEADVQNALDTLTLESRNPPKQRRQIQSLSLAGEVHDIALSSRAEGPRKGQRNGFHRGFGGGEADFCRCSLHRHRGVLQGNSFRRHRGEFSIQGKRWLFRSTPHGELHGTLPPQGHGEPQLLPQPLQSQLPQGSLEIDRAPVSRFSRKRHRTCERERPPCHVPLPLLHHEAIAFGPERHHRAIHPRSGPGQTSGLEGQGAFEGWFPPRKASRGPKVQLPGLQASQGAQGFPGERSPHGEIFRRALGAPGKDSRPLQGEVLQRRKGSGEGVQRQRIPLALQVQGHRFAPEAPHLPRAGKEAALPGHGGGVHHQRGPPEGEVHRRLPQSFPRQRDLGRGDAPGDLGSLRIPLDGHGGVDLPTGLQGLGVGEQGPQAGQIELGSLELQVQPEPFPQRGGAGKGQGRTESPGPGGDVEGVPSPDLDVPRHLLQRLSPSPQRGGHEGHPTVQRGARSLQVQRDLVHHPLHFPQGGKGGGHAGKIHLGSSHLEVDLRRQVPQAQHEVSPEGGAEERRLQTGELQYLRGKDKTPGSLVHHHPGEAPPFQGGISGDPGSLPGAPALERQRKTPLEGSFGLGPESSDFRRVQSLKRALHGQIGQNGPRKADPSLPHAQVQPGDGKGVPLEEKFPLARQGQRGLAGALPPHVQFHPHCGTSQGEGHPGRLHRAHGGGEHAVHEGHPVHRRRTPPLRGLQGGKEFS